NSLARLIRSPMRLAPSRSEYSEWQCRWTNDIAAGAFVNERGTTDVNRFARTTSPACEGGRREPFRRPMNMPVGGAFGKGTESARPGPATLRARVAGGFSECYLRPVPGESKSLHPNERKPSLV